MKPTPTTTPRRKAAPLLERVQRPSDPLVEQPEITDVRGKVGRAQRPHEPIEARRRSPLERRLALLSGAHTGRDVGSLAPALNHLHDDFVGILQMAIDDRNGVVSWGIETGRQGLLGPEVAR